MREGRLGQFSLAQAQIDRAEGRVREDGDTGEAVDDIGEPGEGYPAKRRRHQVRRNALEGTSLKNRYVAWRQ